MSAVVSQTRAAKKLPFGTILLLGVLIAVVSWLILDPSLGQVLLQWLPYLAKGFAMNVLISILAIAIGTFIGVLLGIMELAPYRLVRAPALTYVQVFRNAPHLVLIFAATYIFPLRDRRLRQLHSVSGLDQGRGRACHSGQRPYRRNHPRRHPVHPHRAMEAAQGLVFRAIRRCAGSSCRNA